MGLFEERRELARAVPPEIDNFPVFLRGDVLSFGAEDIFFISCARRDGIVLAFGFPVIVSSNRLRKRNSSPVLFLMAQRKKTALT
jgi:hypothetical protein